MVTRNFFSILGNFIFLGALPMATLLNFSAPAWAIDFTEIERALAAEGIQGYVHGSVPERDLYVFTIQNPNDFFDRAEVSLIAANGLVATGLATTRRHDLVRIRGRFIDVPTPQRHIRVESFELVATHSNPYPTDPYDYSAQIPEELLGQEEAIFLVHAVQSGGRVVALEYRDQVLPLFVRNPQATVGLSRNDIIRVRYRLRSEPNRPTHLALQEGVTNAVTVLESVAALHETPADVEGDLVLFPQAPGIRLNVFALQVENFPTALRQYTLINFADPELFRAIVAKMQSVWDRHPGAYRNGRNKLISNCLRVRARGIFNQVDPNQANTQILIANLDDLVVSDRCTP